MPIYEYRCPQGHTFEVLQRMTDPAVSSCEVCGAAPVEKVLFPVAVHFKGSGFYSTDYGRGGKKAAAKDSDSASSDSKPADAAKKDTGSSETKTAASD